MKISEIDGSQPVDLAAKRSDDRLKNLELMKKRESLQQAKLQVKKKSDALRKASQPDPVA